MNHAYCCYKDILKESELIWLLQKRQQYLNKILRKIGCLLW